MVFAQTVLGQPEPRENTPSVKTAPAPRRGGRRASGTASRERAAEGEGPHTGTREVRSGPGSQAPWREGRRAQSRRRPSPRRRPGEGWRRRGGKGAGTGASPGAVFAAGNRATETQPPDCASATHRQGRREPGTAQGWRLGQALAQDPRVSECRSGPRDGGGAGEEPCCPRVRRSASWRPSRSPSFSFFYGPVSPSLLR